MYNIYFIILHYQNIEDTMNCIKSIKNQKLDNKCNINIVIVDNMSPNKTGIELEKKYKNDSTIEVILLGKNYGFSKANNIAYEYCKNKNDSDLIAIINNDILINDEKFCTSLCDFYKENQEYHIICPDIINFVGQHQNPIKDRKMNLSKAYKNMIYRRALAVFLKIPILKSVLLDIEENREKKWLNNNYNNNLWDEENIDFVPFGAFIIFTKSWIEKEEQAFYSDTFMYMEEDFLKAYIEYKDYKIIYNPRIKVEHLDGRSTEISTQDKYKKYIFRYYNQSVAIKKYIAFIKKYERKKDI